MPQFERFTRRLVPLKREATVTIQKRGTISLNKSAHVALGSPDAVELMFDPQERVVGLRAADVNEDHAHPLRSSTGKDTGPFVVSAMAFTRFYDIDTERTMRWAAYLDGDALCVSLDEGGVEVTSNRARPRDVEAS